MKKKNFLHLLAALLVGVLCVSVTTSCGSDDDSPAAPTTGRIVGIVSDYAHANVPVAGATVTLVQQGAVKVTGSDGRFEFDNLPVGSYTVAVVANNFQSNTQMAYVSAGNVTTCDFSLQRGALDVEFSTLSLTFGKNIDQLVFYITNNTNQLLTYSFSDVPDYVKISPLTGSLSPKSKQAVLVSVPDRSKVTTSGTQIVRVNVGTDSYAIMLTTTNDNVKPEDAGGEVPGGGGGGGEDPVPGDKTDVTRGLLAFYNFDDGTVNNAAGSQNNGVLMGDGQFITDTPNGKGKALFLDQEQYVNVARNPLADKNVYTISLWAKDFGNGYLFTTCGTTSNRCASIFIRSDGTVVYDWLYDGARGSAFIYKATSLQSSGWHMLTIVRIENMYDLYVNGVLVDTAEDTGFAYSAGGNKMQIGGCGNEDSWTDPFKVDNVRVYGVSLTEEEVAQLYNYEKK